MFEYIKNPEEIERRSFEIIGEALGEADGMGLRMDIIKRVIHTTADFEYAEILQFKDGIEQSLVDVFSKGCTIISDTNMIKAGVSKKLLEDLGIKIQCFVADELTHKIAAEKGITRSMAAVDAASRVEGRKIFAIGNAPTALYRIMELVKYGELEAEAVIGVPVGFVGAAESKEELWSTDIPAIISRGRKGGSTIAVAIVNAILREAKKQIG